MRSRQGLLLVEVLIACALAVPLLAVVGWFVLGSSQALAALSVTGRSHGEFLALREQLARDIQQASTVVERVVLDGAVARTPPGPGANTLILQLPAVSAEGAALTGVYDFLVYTIQQTDGQATSLSRQLFTNRDAGGSPVVLQSGSVRVAGTTLLARELLTVPSSGSATPLFTFDRPIPSLVREVALTITLQATESAVTRRTFPQTYTARFRLRNS